MSRYAPSSSVSYAFGPGPISLAVKWIIIINVAIFVVTTFAPPTLFDYFGLVPASVIKRGWIWQLVTYMFLHGGALHILFNMLGIWMFGVELERRWGTNFFLKYYFVSGIGGGLTFLLISLLPFAAVAPMYFTPAVGASGALFGLLLAYAIYWPERPVLLVLTFVPARIFVMIYGGLALLNTFQPSRGVADAAHLGGMVFGYLYLQGGRGGFGSEIKYRYLKWKMNRLRRKFDVYSGGRSDWDGKIH
ncbi:MAG TPA: rhomboid family intramembrane serine protease [Vicinamibacterales bacterium]|jgi:membrane associated rhomboid family serine protease